jgi:ethanolamine utilization protein EutQ (cupin superfamily)
MMSIFKANINTQDYEPHPPYKEKTHYLRKSTDADGRVLRAGFLIADPEKDAPGDGAGDDNVFVIEGRAIIRTDEGEVVEIGPGDFVSCPKGVKTHWEIVERLKVVFVYVE